MVMGGFPRLVQYSIIATNPSLQGRSMLRWSPYSFIKWLLTLTGSQCLGSSTETHPETKPDLQLGQLGQAQFLDFVLLN